MSAVDHAVDAEALADAQRLTAKAEHELDEIAALLAQRPPSPQALGRMRDLLDGAENHYAAARALEETATRMVDRGEAVRLWNGEVALADAAVLYVGRPDPETGEPGAACFIHADPDKQEAAEALCPLLGL